MTHNEEGTNQMTRLELQEALLPLREEMLAIRKELQAMREIISSMDARLDARLTVLSGDLNQAAANLKFATYLIVVVAIGGFGVIIRSLW